MVKTWRPVGGGGNIFVKEKVRPIKTLNFLSSEELFPAEYSRVLLLLIH